MASDLSAVLATCIATVPECLAAAYVDLNSGLVLNIKSVDSHPTEMIDMLAAATADLFQGQNVTAIEDMFRKFRGIESQQRYFEEIIVNSANLLHIFLRGRKYPDHALVFVCRRTANLGMALSKTRAALPEVEMAA